MNLVVKLIIVGLLIPPAWTTAPTNSECEFGYELIMAALEGIRQELKQLRASNQITQNLEPNLVSSSCKQTNINGVVILKPFLKPFFAFCDQTTNGGGWMVIQRRLDGTVSFNRNWTSYREGFGNPDGEYWLGLEKIHQITRSGTYELLVVLKSFDGEEKQAAYGTFSVASENEQYKLNVGNFEGGSAGDSLKQQNGMKFSTPDRDNDLDNSEVNGSCANNFSSGWWFGSCYSSNLNGLYKIKGNNIGIQWRAFNNDWKVLMEVRMMIRIVK